MFNKYPPLDLSPKEFETQVKGMLDAMGIGLADYRSEHRERLEAPDGTYEIDISVTFTALEVSFRTLVECKHHKRPIEREGIQALWAKMQSLGAQKGIMFATSGFQFGAIEFAIVHGIALVEVVVRCFSHGGFHGHSSCPYGFSHGGFHGSGGCPCCGHRHGRAALEILEERLAKGEVGKDEFEEKRKLLGR